MAQTALALVAPSDDFPSTMDDAYVVCKSQSHKFDDLELGAQPKTIRAIPQANGAYQIQFTCRRCGTVRKKTTMPGSANWEPNASYDYVYPDGYLAPPGAGLYKSDYHREFARRLDEQGGLAALALARPAASGAAKPQRRKQA